MVLDMKRIKEKKDMSNPLKMSNSSFSNNKLFMQYFLRDHLSTFCSTGARQYDEILTITFLSTN